MHTSFADQLAGLDLAGFSIGPAPVVNGGAKVGHSAA